MKTKFILTSDSIKFTPLKGLIDDKDYQVLVNCANDGLFECHQCHKNAFLACNVLRKYEAEYCEGYLYCIMPHCFNRIKVNGQYYYVDVTSEIVNKMNVTKKDNAFVRRIFKYDDIHKVFSEKMKCFITLDGFYDQYGISLLFYYDNTGQKVLINKATLKKYEAEQMEWRNQFQQAS